MHACLRCHRAKSADGFSPDPKKKSGLDVMCKLCRAELARERRASRKVVTESAKVLPLRIVPEPVERPREQAPTQPRIDHGPRRLELERTIAAVPGALDDVNAAAVDHARRIADAMDHSDHLDGLPYDDGSRVLGVDVAKLNPQYLVALREAGLTPGPRKAAAAIEAPALKSVSAY